MIREKLDCGTNFIARWKSRFVAERLVWLYSRHAVRAAQRGSEWQEACILKSTTPRKPADGSSPVACSVRSKIWKQTHAFIRLPREIQGLKLIAPL